MISDLLLQGLRTVINPSNKPPLLRLIHPCNSGSSQMLHEFSQCDPSGGVHVLVVLVLDELLVYGISLDALRAESVDGIRNNEVVEERRWAHLRESNVMKSCWNCEE